MNNKQAKNAIIAFLKKYKGKTLLFDSLPDDEMYLFVLTKSYNFFGFLQYHDRMQRTIENANAHKENGYIAFYGDILRIAP